MCHASVSMLTNCCWRFERMVVMKITTSWKRSCCMECGQNMVFKNWFTLPVVLEVSSRAIWSQVLLSRCLPGFIYSDINHSIICLFGLKQDKYIILVSLGTELEKVQVNVRIQSGLRLLCFINLPRGGDKSSVWERRLQWTTFVEQNQSLGRSMAEHVCLTFRELSPWFEQWWWWCDDNDGDDDGGDDLIWEESSDLSSLLLSPQVLCSAMVGLLWRSLPCLGWWRHSASYLLPR